MRQQLRERPAEFLEFQPAVLLGSRFQAIDVTAVGVFDFAAALAVFRAEQVAEDGEEPRGLTSRRARRGCSYQASPSSRAGAVKWAERSCTTTPIQGSDDCTIVVAAAEPIRLRRRSRDLVFP